MMKKEAAYRICSWSKYEAAIEQGESQTIWVGSKALANWTTD
jgi:hypothetical protein